MMQISNVFANVEATYNVFKDLILDKNYSQRVNEIGWPSYKSGISKKVYARQYEDLISDRQFTFLFTDGSALQIYYQYDDVSLKKIRLAYYPVPKTVFIEPEEVDTYYNETYNEILEAHYMLLHDLMGQGVSVSNTTHVRFDYDRDMTSHSVNHFQVDGIQELRIPFKHIITPFHFVDFLVRSMYPAEYIELVKTPAFAHLSAISNRIMVAIGLEDDYLSVFMSM
jgi:hypothetical protein